MMEKLIAYSDSNLLNSDPVENVEQLIEHGAGAIELLMDGCFWEDPDPQIVKLVEILTKYKVDYSLHPPVWDINLTSENKGIREASFSEHKKAIQFAPLLKAKYVAIHPGFTYSPVFSKSEAKKRAREALSRLNEVARPLGVKLAVENVGYHGTSIFTCEEFVEFVTGFDDTIGYLIDTGHAFLNHWDIPELIRQTQTRLLAIHLHDNGGTSDDHLVVGQGLIDWNPIYESLRNTALDFKLVLEYRQGTALADLQSSKEMIKKNLRLR
ncbi:sugar phosphate isomerase/epimerase family protein [Desulfosporosinus shakirovi]|uniref:sugar phosphate isomerase/epimerase family protein n=1 Tax=Desulfosporosinus shakirovi TaxID=2885154 RepID=UPI001E589B7F|nr:sugar phosphate isomerase/epimerase [Desulfosporosinus sp. SRJS8]MCB8814783.1 sugar phosphate isomerase/epimerase [Desulfosporosinus sp. SRJS8]